MGVDPGSKQTARIATDVSIADEGAQRTVIKEVAGEDQQAIAAMIPTLRKRSCASSHFRPPTKSRPCPFLDAKAMRWTVHPDYARRRRHWLRTRNSQATGTAAATI
jgi:hypothetical protein